MDNDPVIRDLSADVAFDVAHFDVLGPDPDLERLLREEEEIDRRAIENARQELLRAHVWFDDDNNFKPPEGAWDDPEGVVAATKVNRLRLRVAAELMRNKTYGRAGINAAIDDADTALGFLFNVGILKLENID
jgi:hypothetical protein